MSNNDTDHKFGGKWTEDKLDILQQYLIAYMSALKNQKFKKVYVDAFAGTGSVTVKSNGCEKVISGSTRISLSVDPPFDEYIFIDIDKTRVESLKQMKAEHSDKNIQIITDDCNHFLESYCRRPDLDQSRVVLFLDPYKSEVKWNTIETISHTKVIDLWYLFPLNMVFRSAWKKSIPPEFAQNILNNLYGSNDWKNFFYQESKQMNFLDLCPQYDRTLDQDRIMSYTVSLLKQYFVEVADYPRILYNTKNAPLFAFIFAMTNPSPAARSLAMKFANHILKPNTRSME